MDPKIECIGEDERFVLFLFRELIDDVVLERGLDGPKHDEGRAFIIRGKLRRKFVEDVELDREGVAAFEVLPVAARPVKRFPRWVYLEALGVDTVFF
ncbi:MAG: hypothetical protein BWX86_00643 [Verrucomicrobia bacterium ADurb.Bin122]|nr:MAG: hypothetical protein BWX86_00643 [Verrucomicrobia bacterium ADurb.Bin122]